MATIDFADIQGNILRGYRKQYVRHLVLRIADAGGARRWLRALVPAPDAPADTRAPRVTDSRRWDRGAPAVCCNLGFTSAGLLAIGASEQTVNSFPRPWIDGMAARASILGDWNGSAPGAWHERYRDSANVHIVLTLHADTLVDLDAYQRELLGGAASAALQVRGIDEGQRFTGDRVHFGYRDSISQPRFEGVDHDGRYDDQPRAPLGSVLLGYPTDLEELRWSLPSPPGIGMNGAFNAFRVLAQDVVGFERWLDEAADELERSTAADVLVPAGHEAQVGAGLTRHAALREVVAAKIVGRWRDGTPLALSPRTPKPDGVPLNAFDYTDDLGGLKCPFGSHIRRTNPRGSQIVQRVANHTRRLVRRGYPYGPEYVPGSPSDGIERGLLGSFLCANLEAQFEAMQYDWVNLGLQDPRITGSNDPLIGANDDASGCFLLPLPTGMVTLRGLPRFVETRGGAYLFLPSLSALRLLSA